MLFSLQSLLSFMESLNEEKEPFVDVLSPKGSTKELDEDQLQLRGAWASFTCQVTVLCCLVEHLWGAALCCLLVFLFWLF